MFGFLKKDIFLLSPSVNGQLFDNGKPLINVTVFRSMTYGQEYLDRAVTDSQGYFSFPERKINTSKPNRMFDNDNLTQHFYLNRGDSELFTILLATYFNYDAENSLSVSQLFSGLRCEILNSANTYDIPTMENIEHLIVVYTRCNMEGYSSQVD